MNACFHASKARGRGVYVFWSQEPVPSAIQSYANLKKNQFHYPKINFGGVCDRQLYYVIEASCHIHRNGTKLKKKSTKFKQN
jgi:hypothetical protein